MVAISEPRWQRIEKALEKIDKATINWISEQEVCRLLNITSRTLSNYIGLGKIPADTYTIAVTGKRVFDKNKLLNI